MSDLKNIFCRLFSRHGENKTLCERFGVLIICLLCMLVPLVFSFYFKQTFVMPKLLLVNIFALFASVIFAYESIKKRRTDVCQDMFFWLLILYGAWLIISTIFSVNVWSSLFGIFGRSVGLLQLLTLLFLSYFTFVFLKTERDVRLVLIVLSGVAMVIVTFGLLQHYGFALQNFELSAVSQRAFSTLGHANHLGGFIVQMSMVLIAAALLVKRRSIYVFAGVLFVVFMWALLETSSRGALVSLGLISFSMSILVLMKWHANITTYLRKFWILLSIILLIFTSTLYFARDFIVQLDVVNRTRGTIQFLQAGNVPDRVSWMYSSFDMMKDYPIFGTGVDTYKDMYNQYRRLDYRAPGDEQDMIVPEAAHNELLNIASTQGIPALIVYLILIGYVEWKAYCAFRATRDNTKAGVLLLLICAVNAYVFQTLLSFGTISTLLLFYIVLGILRRYTMLIEGDIVTREFDFMSGMKQFFNHTFIRGMSVMMLVLFMALHLGIIYNFSKADRLLRATEYVGKMADYRDKGYLPHITLMRRAVELNPYSYVLYEKLGEYYIAEAKLQIANAVKTNNITQFTVAEKYLRDAVSAYENAVGLNSLHPMTHLKFATAYRLLAEVQFALGNKDAYEENLQNLSTELEKSVELSHNNPYYYVQAGDVYVGLGIRDRARELYEIVRDMRPEYPDIDVKIKES